MTTTYTGTVLVANLKTDTSFVGPVAIPSNFVGVHNGSIGTRTHSGAVATASVALVNGKPVPTMTNVGANYNQFIAAVCSGGDGTEQTVMAPLLAVDGTISGLRVIRDGNHINVAPSVAIVTTGGADIPVTPPAINLVRSHDYRGSIGGAAIPAPLAWFAMDPSDGSGNYNWTACDEFMCMHAARGRKVLFNIHGTPTNYATSLAYTGVSFENQLGASSPLNAAGLVVGTPNAGLDGFVKALITRYNINSSALINPVTGLNFPAGTKMLHFIEWWNEPQFGTAGAALAGANGKYWLGTAAQLVTGLRIVKNAVLATDPSIKVMSSGFVGNYPMGVGTDNAHHMYNFLSAVDSVEGKTGYYWTDIVSVHPYERVENNSPFQRSTTRPFFDKWVEIKQCLTALGGMKPISASEWGFYDPMTVFQADVAANGTNTVLSAIQIKRIIAEHAICGLHSSVLYALDNTYSGYACQNRYTFAALNEISAAINGKTIVQVNRRRDGAIQLIFSDGTTYFTG